MKTFLAVSRCLSCKEIEGGRGHQGRFHFKGFLWGFKVSEILVFSKCRFQKGRDYILHLKLIAESNGILKTRLLKKKPLDEIRRNFF